MRFSCFLNCTNRTKSRNAPHMLARVPMVLPTFLDAYSEPCQTFKMERLVKIVSG